MRLLSCILFGFLFMSCSNLDTIKLTGSYGDFAGGIEWKINPAKTEKNNIPTLESPTGEAFLIDRSMIDTINDMLGGVMPLGVEPNIIKLQKKIKDWREKNGGNLSK